VPATGYLNCGMVPERYEDSAHPYIVPSQCFSTRDGDLVIMPMADRMWVQLCDALGLDDLESDRDLRTAPGRLENASGSSSGWRKSSPAARPGRRSSSSARTASRRPR
jgi:crotonobetainyl-CoA:carnitine CoA-transferase CaiB-like acyl-CoA transferase